MCILPTKRCTLFTDIWGNSDRFHYLYASTSQVASIEMFVKSFTGANMHEWAKGGLMIRKHPSPVSEYFGVLVTGSNKLRVQWRSSHKGTTHKAEAARVQNSNIWLKITKSGNTFNAYYKINADDSWTEIGSEKTINFGSDPFSYGIAVTSSDVAKEAKLEASRWSSVGVSGGVMVRFTAYVFFSANHFFPNTNYFVKKADNKLFVIKEYYSAQ